ncbi:MAG: hypothetical protein KatS3mg009_1898 [Acidimicrobiia bacterium]|nr:MAG: hypothetical protein KatS3mg009_1898 [Acidimicrobiia bacterium]
MSLVHALVDSDAFRWVAKRGPTRVVFRSRAYRRLDLARRRRWASRAARASRAERPFAQVRTFCFFIGHNKSGTSMLGALLDAHPRMVVSDELDALSYVDAGFGRDELFHLILRGSRTEARKGRVTARRLEPYSYEVPGWSQGRAERPLVVGDSTSGTSTRRLGADPALLDRLRRLVGVDVRLVQVVRNPFDPIAVMMVRGGRSFENAADHYFRACETLRTLRARLGPGELVTVRYERFCEDPAAELARVSAFLGVEPDRPYLDACAAIIRREPVRDRARVEWSADAIARVERGIAGFDFLEGYSHAD